MVDSRSAQGRIGLVAAGILWLASGFGQDASQGPVKFKTDNMEVRNAPSWLFWLEGDDWRFKGAGKPMFAHWNNQRLTIYTNQITGVATPGQGKYALQSATLEGAVKAIIERPSASGQASALQEVELHASKADYLAAAEKWTLTGGVSVRRTDQTAGEDTLLNGSSGVVILYPQSQGAKQDQSIKSATVHGSTLTMHTRRRTAVKGIPGKFEFKKYTFGGSSDKLDFDDGAHTITLTGHVRMSGDDPLLQGSVENVDLAVITLDEKGQPKSIQLDGEPGVTKLHEKPPPDAGTWLGNSYHRVPSPSRGRREGLGTQAEDLRLRSGGAVYTLPTTFALRPSSFTLQPLAFNPRPSTFIPRPTNFPRGASG